ncbi:EAL domain-containing protein [Aeromonas caviae]
MTDTKLSKRVILRNELQEAIKAGQLFLNYQPQVNQHGEICGLEALVRWKHPNKGLVSPADFIPIAEETGQIIHLGRWVTTQACKDAKQLLDMGILKGRMAVNLSQLQFHRPGFMTTLLGILNRTNLPPTYLELELTESILMRNSEGAIDILRELESKGITTSIDDFGTGAYSGEVEQPFRPT